MTFTKEVQRWDKHLLIFIPNNWEILFFRFSSHIPNIVLSTVRCHCYSSSSQFLSSPICWRLFKCLEYSGELSPSPCSVYIPLGEIHNKQTDIFWISGGGKYCKETWRKMKMESGSLRLLMHWLQNCIAIFLSSTGWECWIHLMYIWFVMSRQ